MLETPLVKEIVLEKLRNQILSLRSFNSIRIPSERSLSEHLGVSRLSVRAALKKLAEEGLLVQMRGKGTYITPLARLHSINLICSPDIKSTDPYYNKFLAEITTETAKRSINLVMVDSGNPVPRQKDTPLIIVGLLDCRMLDSVVSAFSPVIALQEYPWLADITQISFDDYKIGCDAAKILYEHNHKNILHLSGPEKYPSAFYRKKGFLDASEALGIHAGTISGKMNWAGGYSLGEHYLRNYTNKDKPTAVFAANDWMAAGFMSRIQADGFSIPDDVSIIGCDNIPLSGEYTPPLSTFDLNMKLLVAELFKTLEGFAGEFASQSAAKPGDTVTAAESRAAPWRFPDEHAAAPKCKRVMLPATPVLRASINKLK